MRGIAVYQLVSELHPLGCEDETNATAEGHIPGIAKGTADLIRPCSLQGMADVTHAYQPAKIGHRHAALAQFAQVHREIPSVPAQITGSLQSVAQHPKSGVDARTACGIHGVRGRGPSDSIHRNSSLIVWST